jgi:hypothetical protein
LGGCYLWAVFFKLKKWPNFFGYFFPRKMLRINVDLKMGWATFWAIFSQTHLVTLVGGATGVQGCQMVCFQTKYSNLGKF